MFTLNLDPNVPYVERLLQELSFSHKKNVLLFGVTFVALFIYFNAVEHFSKLCYTTTFNNVMCECPKIKYDTTYKMQ